MVQRPASPRAPVRKRLNTPWKRLCVKKAKAKAKLERLMLQEQKDAEARRADMDAKYPVVGAVIF